MGEWIGSNGFLVGVTTSGEDVDDGRYGRELEILAAKSAGMFVRTDVAKGCGGFDPSYFIYTEETDFCWRIWLSGFRVVLAPDSVVYHKFGTSSVILADKINYLVKFHGTKNYIQTLVKNLSFSSLIWIFPLHIACWMGMMVFFFFKLNLMSVLHMMKAFGWLAISSPGIIKKRRQIQSMRTITDEELFKKVMKKRPLTYFIRKFLSRKKVGQTTGWQKE